MTRYITTAIPYVNAAPHIGFALEAVQADVLARAFRGRGDAVRFLTGTDDNALKNVLAAEEVGEPVEGFVTRHSAEFSALKGILDLSNDDFIRTREERHIRGVQKFWRACKAGDIYTKQYEGLYCVGCEEFKTEHELRDGRCLEHPARTLERVAEENYFFRLSRYAGHLEELIRSDKLRILPVSRKNEMLKFIEGGLEDFSISRSSARAKGWGVPVPDDPAQVMYVWFDALTNYVNALGYADDDPLFREFWAHGDAIFHMVGKGISRFHAIYWPAMLLSAGIRLPTTVFVHGYLTAGGQKISKSLGNGVHPKMLVDRYGTDAVRYFLLREIPSAEDGDFSEDKFRARYSADLANGIGNFASRVLALAEPYGPVPVPGEGAVLGAIRAAQDGVRQEIDAFRFSEALMHIAGLVSFGDRRVNETKPWERKDAQVMGELLTVLGAAGELFLSFMPGTAEKISSAVTRAGATIMGRRLSAPLFPRITV